MITLDGRVYEQQAPEVIAADMIARMNRYFADNNVRNKDGEVIYLEANTASVFYQMILSQGFQDSVLQSLILAAASDLSFSECSDEKLMDWARIMRIRRRQASNTTVDVSIEADALDASITTNNICTVLIGGKKVVFRPAYDAVIPAGKVKNIIFICDELGPVEVTRNMINSFDIPVDNVKTVSSAPGIAGRKEETLTELRWRMGQERFTGSDVEMAQSAISQLAGISFCTIYVNYDTTLDKTVASIIVPPRHCVVFIQGYSPYIAREYYNYMNMPTVNIQDNPRFIMQEKTTLAGQKIPMYFVTPRIQDIYVKVIRKESNSDTIKEKIQTIIMSVNSTYGIGENVTSAQLQELMDEEGPEYSVMGILISESGMAWGVSAKAYEDSIPRMLRENITVEQFVP